MLHPDSSPALEASPVGEVSAHVEPLHASTLCLDALELFLGNTGQASMPVVSHSLRPVAIIERQGFVEYFARPFTKEIHRWTPVVDLPETIVNHHPIVIDIATPLDEVAQRVVDGGFGQMIAGYIVTKDGLYAGVGNGHTLLDEITRRRQAELYALAHYDHLTGLPNRRLFLDRLGQACRHSQHQGDLVAVMFVDVDRFKMVNDTHGHGAGDQLLREIGQRISMCARDSDTVARVGGDEFALIVSGLESADGAAAAARRVVEAMRAPFVVAGTLTQVTLSIGVSIYPRDSDDLSRLMASADTAMFGVKQGGRNGYRLFDTALEREVFDALSIESEMRAALASGEFYLDFQPVVAFGSQASDKVEALIRWKHPRRGHLSPGQFIPVAEKGPLIKDIGAWVLRTACAQLARWREQGMAIRRVAVNVSAKQLQDEAFLPLVQEAMQTNCLDRGQLILEVTEGLLLQQGPRMVDTFQRLKSLGACVVLDDFGTGFSSLSYLRQLPLDGLKIDQSFVRGIDHSSSGASIVRSIAGLGKSLGMMVTVEGVETSEELDTLKSCGCDEAQGYLFSRPLSPEGLVNWVRELGAQSEGHPA